jgi:hypothetical protein
MPYGDPPPSSLDRAAKIIRTSRADFETFKNVIITVIYEYTG